MIYVLLLYIVAGAILGRLCASHDYKIALKEGTGQSKAEREALVEFFWVWVLWPLALAALLCIVAHRVWKDYLTSSTKFFRKGLTRVIVGKTPSNDR